MDQMKAAKAVVAELHADGTAEDLEASELLDMMAVVGVEFAPGVAASAAFLAEATGQTQEEVERQLAEGP